MDIKSVRLSIILLDPKILKLLLRMEAISVMVINTQAFAAKGADARRIHQELDHFGSRRPH